MSKVEDRLKKKVGSFFFNPLIGNFIAWTFASCFIASTTYINDENGWYDNNFLIVVGLIIGCISTTYLRSVQEAYRIEVLKLPIKNHNWRGFIAACICCIIGLVVHGIGDGFHSWRVLIEALTTAGFSASIYLATFDSFLNYHRGKSLLYISHDSNASQEDQLFANLPNEWEGFALLAIKSIILVGAYWAEVNMLSKLI